MEVVEVNDFQCHSDGEEVVLLDLDKTNDADDSMEVHEVTVDEANRVIKVEENSNGIDVIETCDNITHPEDLDISEIVCQIPNLDDEIIVEEGSCDNSIVIDISQTPKIEISIETEDGQKKDCVEVHQNRNEGVIESMNKTNHSEGSNSKINDTNGPIVIEVTSEVTEESIDNSNRIVKKESMTNETKNPDGSIVLTKDNVSVTIPQHIAGRDISSLTEETLSRSGKRMLKPRFGVKVPYIHMTSQIVTQDEIAKELFERFQQKYPLTRVDKPDKLFSMKLAHRLANQISPLKTTDGKSKHVSKTPNKSSNKLANAKVLLTKKKEKLAEKMNASQSSNIATVENSLSQIQNELSNNVSNESSLQINDSQQIDQITNSLLQSLDQSADQHSNLSEDKNCEKISSNEELIAILEDFENIETAETNGNKVPETPKPVETKKVIRSTTRTKRSKPKLDPEIEKQIALKQLQEVSRPKRYDSHYSKRKAENEKKLLNKNDVGTAQKRKKPDDVPEVKIAIDQYIKSYTDKRQSTIKMEPSSNDETVDDVIVEVERETKTSDVIVQVQPGIKTSDVAKARTMREINRLLSDEGAINMIYSLEKRRSPGNNNSKNILPSTRRKKKDLMLKTKLVKNAMLKMSSPATSFLTANRLGRRSDVCTPSPENKCTRKTSIDSQGSDQSGLDNFAGRKTIPANESKIIRKHSSSSEASSVGGSPILPVPNAIPINANTKHTPVKALRVYTRKTKNSDELLNSNDQSFNEVSKGTNKIAKIKNPTNQKVKKQPVQASSKTPSK